MQHASSFNTLEITSDSLSIFLFVLISKRTINVLAINNCQWVVYVLNIHEVFKNSLSGKFITILH